MTAAQLSMLLEGIDWRRPERTFFQKIAVIVKRGLARRASPEDVGGLRGFEEFLSVMADPTDEEHETIMTWYGRPFDADDISSAIINQRIGKLAKRRATGKAAFEKSRNRIN